MREFHFIREGQPGSELYTFVVSASTLLEIARVERFNEDPNHKGVQRLLHYPQVVKIRDAMRQSHATFAEPILGNLEGEWIVDKDTNTLMGNRDGYLSVDDGQQRIAALHLLSEEERSVWQLKVTATLGISYEQRVRMFLQQTKRLKIDGQLVLQLQDKTGLFPDNISERAYALGKRLANDPNSPLFGLIRLEERPPRKHPTEEDAKRLAPLLSSIPPAVMLREHTLGIINVGSIFGELKKVVSSAHSVILKQDAEVQQEVVFRIISAAKEIWPKEWSDPQNYFLRRTEGVKSLILLPVVGQQFKKSLALWLKQGGLSRPQENRVKGLLSCAERYAWDFKRFRGPDAIFPSPAEIARQLDSLIFQKSKHKL